MSRLIRIARQITAILTPEEIPEPTNESREHKPSGIVSKEFRTRDDIVYKVRFTPRRGLQGAWEISFDPKSGPEESKHPYDVMQNVAAMVRGFVQEYDPRYFVLNPSSQSRKKVYLAMMKRLFPEAKLTSDVDVNLVGGWNPYPTFVYELPSGRQAARSRSTKGPVYRAGRKPLDMSRSSPPGGFYFGDRPRTADFGSYVTKANITIENPYIPGMLEDENVLAFVTEQQAKAILGEGYDPEYYDAESWLEALEISLEQGAQHWQNNQFIAAIKDAGYDGVWATDAFGGESEYVVFNLSQIEVLDTYQVSR